MFAISLWQVWASGLFTGLKPDETRHWPAPAWLIGQRMAIHAAKRWTRAEKEFWWCLSAGDREAFAKIGIHTVGDIPFGVLIGTAVLTRCVRTEDAGVDPASSNYRMGNFGPERFAWRFEDHMRFPSPIPCVGRQGIFSVEVPT